MKPAVRAFAVFLLMLMLPLQGLAAVCMQVCIKAEAHAVHASLAAAQDGADHHCGGSDENAPGGDSGECCSMHAFVAETRVSHAAMPLAALETLPYAARWTSFIPEEPSPPPIALARAA